MNFYRDLTNAHLGGSLLIEQTRNNKFHHRAFTLAERLIARL